MITSRLQKAGEAEKLGTRKSIKYSLITGISVALSAKLLIFSFNSAMSADLY